MTQFCTWVRETRKKKGITLRELATKSGLSIGFLCDFERGSRDAVTIEHARAIAAALGRKLGPVLRELGQ